MIKLQQITKIYGKGEASVCALDGVDLTIEKGDLLAIVGPSGSGKSTLLNIIGCLDKPSSGTYHLNGQKIESYNTNQLARIRNQVLGFIVQDFALIDKYSVFQNIAVPLTYANVSRKEQRKRVEDVLAQMGMESKINKPASQLSIGQRQRAAICRAIINNPDIVLADEPTGALDQKTGQDVVRLLQEINEVGKTVIIVTHDMSIAKLCKHTISICDGKVVEKI